MKDKFTIILLFTVMFFSTSACGANFKGKVIDADTKEPIEGAIVVASWTEEAPTAAGSTSRLRDVKETLTDKNGEWAIKGPSGKGIFSWLRFFTSLYSARPPVFIVFKPGYCSWPKGFGVPACKDKIKGFDIEKTIELPKLTDRSRESLLRNIPFIAAEKDGKIPHYENLLEQDLEGKRR